jgi:hypothetical protein
MMAAATTAHASTKKSASPTWATLNQWGNREIKRGGIYGRGWGQASPKLKYLAERMIVMKFGKDSPALCYARRESGLNPAALSRTNDHHLFQLNYAAHHNAIDFNKLDTFALGYGIVKAWQMSSHGTDFGPWQGGSYSC